MATNGGAGRSNEEDGSSGATTGSGGASGKAGAENGGSGNAAGSTSSGGSTSSSGSGGNTGTATGGSGNGGGTHELSDIPGPTTDQMPVLVPGNTYVVTNANNGTVSDAALDSKGDLILGVPAALQRGPRRFRELVPQASSPHRDDRPGGRGHVVGLDAEHQRYPRVDRLDLRRRNLP